MTVVCREGWGAEPPGAGLIEHTPLRLTVHHSAVAQTSPAQGPARVRRHQRHHQNLGWPDLAYHFVVDRLGVAYEGRDPRFRGDTGTEYDTTGHFLVCLEGEFDSQRPTEAQIATVAGLFGWATAAFGIDPSTIAGHSAYASTGCPGGTVEALLADGSLEDAIRSAGNVELVRLCGERGAVEVARIEALEH